jgi:hypothetical protein
MPSASTVMTAVPTARSKIWKNLSSAALLNLSARASTVETPRDRGMGVLSWLAIFSHA